MPCTNEILQVEAEGGRISFRQTLARTTAEATFYLIRTWLQAIDDVPVDEADQDPAWLAPNVSTVSGALVDGGIDYNALFGDYDLPISVFDQTKVYTLGVSAGPNEDGEGAKVGYFCITFPQGVEWRLADTAPSETVALLWQLADVEQAA